MNPAWRWNLQADQAGQRYEGLLSAFSLIYAQAAIKTAPASPRTLAWAAQQAYVAAERYLHDETGMITQAIDAESHDALQRSEAHGSPDAAVPVAAHCQTIADTLLAALRVQTERDIEQILRTLRADGLRKLLAHSPRPSPATNLVFTYLDRAQRRWPSRRFVRTLWRHALVLAWNESTLLSLSLSGVKARIAHADPAHAGVGTVIGADAGDATWDMVRDDSFHPNTNAWLEASVSAP